MSYLQLPFNRRQLAADAGGAPGAGTPPAEPPKEGKTPAEDKIIFTPEQQAHLEKLLAAQYAKLQSKTEKKVSALEQAAKLANMTAEEQMKEKLKQAEERLKEFETRELQNQFKVELAGRGLPQDFADYINAGDAEAAKKAVDFLTSYKKSFEDKIKLLEDEVKKAGLRGAPPKAPENAPGSTLLDAARKAAGLT